MAEISVYFYKDHRAYLEAAYLARKQVQPGLTLGAFSRQLGFGSGNYARLIFDGKRNLTVDNIHAVAAALHLTSGETEYFEALVLQHQVSTDRAKKFYRKRQARLKREQPRSSARLPAGQLSTQWYFPVILLLLDKTPVNGAVEFVNSRFPSDIKVVEAALRRFLEMGLLHERDGIFQLNYSHQVFHDVRSRGAKHKEFLRNQLELSQRMLETGYEKGAKFFAHTFTVSAADFQDCHDRLRSVLAELTALSDRAGNDTPAARMDQRVVQLNMQLFTVAGLPIDA